MCRCLSDIAQSYFVTTLFSSLSQNRRICIRFLFWWVLVSSNIFVKVPFDLLSVVASHCDSNGPNPSCKTYDAISLLIVSDFAIFELGNIFWNKEGIPSHALRLKSSCATLYTHGASEAETFFFKLVMWWFWDDNGEIFSTETVVSFVRSLLQLFPKRNFYRDLRFGLFEYW